MSSCSSHKKAVSTGSSTKILRHIDVSVASSKSAEALLVEADKWIGTPYKYGGTQRGKGVDCSGFVNRVYADALSISLPRSSAEQADYCKKIDKKNLDIGDLLFFSPKGKGRVNHVGMYIGDGFMVHSSVSKGVIICRIDEPYFKTNYKLSGRVERYEKMLASESKSKKKKKSSPEPDQPQVSIQVASTQPTKSEEIPSETMKRLIQSEKKRKTIIASVPKDSVSTKGSLPIQKTNKNITEKKEKFNEEKTDSICSSYFD